MNLPLRLQNYIARYAPSRKKVHEYLTKKNCQNIEEILLQVGYNENLMMDMWMRTFLSLWKGSQDIRMKFLKKWFPKDIVAEYIERYNAEIQDWSSHESAILQKIQTLHTRGKSARFILQTMLGQYPYFREYIEEHIKTLDSHFALEKEVQKYKNRYTVENSKEREKIIASLLRKGFRYSDIQEILKKDSSNS
jgi:SOS response regulatory protein OraA/RecX